ncbi:MAG: RelA/SpoT family protein [Bacteroidota bacterium]
MTTKNLKSSLLISDQEKRLIRRLYKKLCQLVNAPNETQKNDLNAAFQMSYEQHAHIRRRSGDPYIIHPLNVALILVEEMGITNVETIVCALLHDVVEDTPVTLAEIKERFGDKVTLILDALTKIKEPSEEHAPTTSMQAINFQKLFSYFSKDMRICAIKIADRLDNMRSLHFLSKEKQLKIAHETKEFYAPLAHRLGLANVKSTLETLYLKYVEPEAYKMVVKNIQIQKRGRSKTIKNFSVPIIRELDHQGIKYRMETRLKSIYSIYSKMLKKQAGFDQIHDICGLRIILDYSKAEEVKKCWEVYSIITKLYHINPKRTRDWLSTPRSNGYESLHITAMSKKGEWVEIQIRSERMHKVATQGIAAHWKYKDWKYKKSSHNPLGENVNYQQLMQQMGDLAKQDVDVSQAVRDAQLALYEKDMCIFTGVGSRIFLPRDATIFDFAIETMHEKGAYCTYAIVDGEKHTKDYVLTNGQQVNAIVVNLSQKLKPEWRLLTNTPKTRKIWKQVFSEFGKKQKDMGKRKIEKILKKHDFKLSDAIEKEIKYFFKETSIDDVYYKIGDNSIPISLLDDFIQQKLNLLARQKKGSDPQNHLFLRGTKSDIYELSSCCAPVAGDELLAATIPAKSIIEVHRADCQKAANIPAQNANNIISVSWQHTDYTFKRSIDFTALLNQETKKKVLHAIQKYDIIAFTLTKDDESENTSGTIVLYVQNANELSRLMSDIKKIEGVMQVKRGHIND